VLFASLVAACAPCGVLAQQWSAEQQEVWQSVEAYTEAFAQGELDEFLSYFHEDFTGWNIGDAVPRNKAFVEKAVSQAFLSQQMLWYHLTPLIIEVHGDVAVVHYYATWTRGGMDGTESTTTARWTDVLLKQGGRWVMIADHGGTVSGG
jgi:ketosteroid isomerase-like protein